MASPGLAMACWFILCRRYLPEQDGRSAATPVDRNSGAVDHRIGVAGVPGGGQGQARLRGAGSQQRHRPGEISPGGGGIDVESGGQLAFAYAGQDEQGRHRDSAAVVVVIRSGLLLSPVPEEILSGCIYRSWFFLWTSKSSGGRHLALGVAADAGGES